MSARGGLRWPITAAGLAGAGTFGVLVAGPAAARAFPRPFIWLAENVPPPLFATALAVIGMTVIAAAVVIDGRADECRERGGCPTLRRHLWDSWCVFWSAAGRLAARWLRASAVVRRLPAPLPPWPHWHFLRESYRAGVQERADADGDEIEIDPDAEIGEAMRIAFRGALW